MPPERPKIFAPHKRRLSRPDTDRLYRCGCGTNSIHINAWGELGTCTLQYEHRISLRAHSLKDAVARSIRSCPFKALSQRQSLPFL